MRGPLWVRVLWVAWQELFVGGTWGRTAGSRMRDSALPQITREREHRHNDTCTRSSSRLNRTKQ